MPATTVDTLNIPPLWYPVVQIIQAANEPLTPGYLDKLGKGFILGPSSTVSVPPDVHNIEQLGWSKVEALETHLRLRSFVEDWDAPGMEAYDEM